MTKTNSKQPSNLYAFESNGELYVCQAVLNGSDVQILKSVSAAIDDEQFAEKLNRSLQEQKLINKGVTILVQRRDVSLRMFQLPHLQGNELDEFIPLQAETRTGRPLDEVYYDYQTVMDGSSLVAASFASIQKEKIDRIKDHLQEAGLQPVSAVVPELILPRLSNTQELRLDILLRDGVSEIIASAAGVVLASKTCKLDNQSEHFGKKVAANWNLLKTSLPTHLQQCVLSEIKVYSLCEAPTEIDSLRERFPELEINLGTMNRSLRHPELAVLLSAPTARQDRVDFIQPREKSLSQLSKRQLLTRVAAALILLVTGFACWAYSENTYLDQQIESLKLKQAELKELIDRGQTTMENKRSIEQWSEVNVDWTHEIQQFCEYLPSNERIYLTRMQVDVSPRSGVAVLRVSGKARENVDVTKLNRRLVTESNYVMHPVTIHPSATDRLYQTEFEFEAELDRDVIGHDDAG